MKPQIMGRCSWVWLLVITCLVVACGPRKPHAQEDSPANDPGDTAKSEKPGVSVRAPLGIEVKVDSKGVAVKAPGVSVKTDSEGVAVSAPGVSFKKDSKGVDVKAPGVDVKAGADGVSVDAPAGVSVKTGSAKQP